MDQGRSGRSPRERRPCLSVSITPSFVSVLEGSMAVFMARYDLVISRLLLNSETPKGRN